MHIIDGFKLRTICGENIVVGEGIKQLNFNKMVSLNSSATLLWRRVEGIEFDVDMLSSILVEEYGIDSALATADSSKIVNDWLEAGVIE